MDKTVQQLQREIETLRRRLDQRPVITTIKPLAPYLKIVIDGGNTLDSGQDGILWVADVDTVPSAYDPNVTSSFVDGIGRGELYIDNEKQDGYVLVVNDSGSSLGISLLADHTIWCGGFRKIPVDGGGYVTAYLCG